MKENYDIIIIGAGIIGLSTAYNLLQKDRSLKICIIEKESGPARHQTGHNSGVIHSGIYYKPGSLKAINCIRGYKMLLNFCTDNMIPFEICGKVIIATDENEFASMNMLYERAIANGLDGCKLIDRQEIREIEPNASGEKGIHVPQTGIVDYKTVSAKLADLIVESNGRIIYGEEVKMISEAAKEINIKTNKSTYTSKRAVACAGLFADRIASMTKKVPDFMIIPFRGEYYELRKEKRDLIRNLIYPVPDPSFPFLGVHFTRRIDGSIEAGPNAVLAFKREGYKKNDFNLRDSFDTLAFAGFRKLAAKYMHIGIGEFKRSFSRSRFAESLQKLVPSITEKDLLPGGSGVRAQACGKDGNLIDDFLFIEDELMINVCNAPSPAATASLSIGETISDKVLN
ncbi:MAG: L-2-hydroxyglutarate oxidase [Ignavibacteria bacterium]|nr:L-2-hydroxyglutarate oxidase [Ignavibacteria bacterium]